MVRPEYRLVRLKAKTAQDLNRLKDETGQASLNDLITKMIQLTDAHRKGLKETGWESPSSRGEK
jgi:signal transduction histidine kinase